MRVDILIKSRTIDLKLSLNVIEV